MKKEYFICIVLIGSLMTMLNNSMFAQENRSYDGLGNNIDNPEWGAAGTNQLQFTTVGYFDGISEPGGVNRPNSREISNLIFKQNGLLPDATELSDFAWVWGQFIDHDITASPDDASQPFNIIVPVGDEHFDPFGTGLVEIHMNRSAFDPSTGTDVNNPRAFPNAITAFIDGSGVYGSDEAKSRWLRTFENGKLKSSAGNHLPYNTITGHFDGDVDPNAPFMAMPNPLLSKWFVAGDFRANENVLLTSIHTTFMREHNRICEELAIEKPLWDDEKLYQKARKIVGGHIQSIVFEEWLPTMGVTFERYQGYDESINPGIMNIFSSSAYRYGHTVISGDILRVDNDGKMIPEGNLKLRDAFFNPPVFVNGGGVEPLLKGMATQVEQEFDTRMIDDLRNFLFGPPGAGGLDLAALNISRGRERGLGDYNTIRSDFGLPTIDNFDELTENDELNSLFEEVFDDVDDIDSWVGFLAEDHMQNTLFGETVMKIMEVQFRNLRNGDRFYYENDLGLTSNELETIKNTRLVDIINRNSRVEFMQYNVFIAQIHTAVSELIIDPLKMSVYPNPASKSFFINAFDVKQGIAKIELRDLVGHVVFQKEVLLSEGISNFEVNLGNNITSGIYFLTLIAKNQAGTTKISIN